MPLPLRLIDSRGVEESKDPPRPQDSNVNVAPQFLVLMTRSRSLSKSLARLDSLLFDRPPGGVGVVGRAARQSALPDCVS